MSGISTTVIDFLKALEKHNNREWFNAHKDTYKAAKKDFDGFVQVLIQGTQNIDPRVEQLAPKDCVFRIYRDVRFSKNKAPYKTNFGAAISPGGRKSPYATYYIHVQPGNSFVAGGMYMPDNKVLKKVRQEIDYNEEEFRQIINSKRFKQYFGTLGGNKLKTSPKDYPNDHPAIDLLRHKGFIGLHKVTDNQLTKSTFSKQVLEVFEALYPLNAFLNRALD